MHNNTTDNTLKTFTAVMTVLFLLIAFRTAYGNFSEAHGQGNFFLLGMNTVWIFTLYEAPYLLAVYVLGPMVSDAMPGLWSLMNNTWAKLKSLTGTKTVIQLNSTDNLAVVINPTLLYLPAYEHATKQTEINVDNPEIEICVEAETDSSQEPTNIITQLSEEIINYTYGTFKNVLTAEQIEKLLNNFRNFNNGKKFEVVEKTKLPDGIFQFDLFHFCWNVSCRIYSRKQCDTMFRTRTAHLIKSSFPLTAENIAESSIYSKMTNDDRPFSIPILKSGKPLEPKPLKALNSH